MFVARKGRSEPTTTILDESQVRDLVEKMLKTTGRRIDMSSSPHSHANMRKCGLFLILAAMGKPAQGMTRTPRSERRSALGGRR